MVKKKNGGEPWHNGLEPGRFHTLKMVNKSRISVMDLPSELVVDILALAAGSSHTNLFNLKLSCKVFKDLAEEGHIYKHVSLENIPVIPWNNGGASLFIDRCIDNGNPEALYRLGVVELFSNGKIKTGLQHLRKAIDAGHLAASYLHGMVSMIIGEEELMMQGFQLLARLCAIDKARECREKFCSIIEYMWLNYNNWSNFGTGPPTLCTKQHWKRTGWSAEYEFFEDESCEACKCDAEIAMFFRRFGRRI